MSWLVCVTIGKRDSTRVAVMAVPRDRVPAVGDFVPHRVGDEFVLRHQRPVAVAARVPAMDTLHLLEEQDIGGHAVQLFAQLVDDHGAAPGGKSLCVC